MAFVSLEGQILGKYRVLAPLGSGGMARVYRAYHPQLNRYVALKVLYADLSSEPEFLARFRQEAQAVAALRHPNIVQVHDFDSQGDLHFMVMELLGGDTLKARLNDHRLRRLRMPLDEAARILTEALAGLSYAHGEGLIHRDLKPANLMLTERGQAVITDFGIAHILGGVKHTVTGALMGTVNYMAPELGLHGRYGVASDLYAMGVVMYEMLAGRVPFDADTPLAVLMKHVNEPLPLPRRLNPAIPESFEGVLLKALAKQPEDRFAGAQEMIEALGRAAQAAGLPLPAPVLLPGAAVAGSPDRAIPAGVFSGGARAALADAPLIDDDTDTTLQASLAGSTAAKKSRTGSEARRALVAGLGALAAVNLISLFLGGALDNLGGFMGRVWPVEVLLLALLFSLLLAALPWPWLIVPVSVSLGLGTLLGYFAISGQWQRWLYWPMLALLTPAASIVLVRWARAAPTERAPQLGRAASLAAAALIVYQLLAALVAAFRQAPPNG